MKMKQSPRTGWKTYRFDQIATNVNVRVDNPSESGLEHYVGLEHLDSGTLKISRWGSPGDVEATKLIFKKGDVIFGRRRAYQRKLGVAEFDGICSAHAMVLRAKPDVVLPELFPFFLQSDVFMNKAIEISVGSLSPTINWKTLASQGFSLPPRNEQEQLLRRLSLASQLSDAYRIVSASAKSVLSSTLVSVFTAEGFTPANSEISESALRTGWRLLAASEICAAPIAEVRSRTVRCRDC